MSVCSFGLVRRISSSLLSSCWWRYGWLSNEEGAPMLVQTTWSQIGMLVRFNLSCHLTLSLSTKPTSTHAPLIGYFSSLFCFHWQISINDSFILESCVYKILKRYLGREKYYSQLVDLFIETTRQTELGQLLDLTSQPLVGAIDLNRFTLERYRWQNMSSIELC